MNLFINKLGTNPEQFFIWILVVVFSICCHEYAHAQVALWQGDPTAADKGHLTLNPLKQMGVFSLIMLAFIGIAWGAVPVNPNRMRHKYSRALVAFAGPLTNLILFILFCIGITLSLHFNFKDSAKMLFQIGAILNIVLFMFNMVPVPPLDGWGVLTGLYPKISLHNSEFAKGAVLCIMLLVFISFSYIFAAGNFLTINMVRAMLTITGLQQ
ncbi:MAG: site-2 protease family protein [Victivallaceae bacterium]|nr:site-2 protease family protein [Victivallaceae bacterium]